LPLLTLSNPSQPYISYNLTLLSLTQAILTSNSLTPVLAINGKKNK
jgi:hypothetical protein